jgi:hypothetical protein
MTPGVLRWAAKKEEGNESGIQIHFHSSMADSSLGRNSPVGATIP